MGDTHASHSGLLIQIWSRCYNTGSTCKRQAKVADILCVEEVNCVYVCVCSYFGLRVFGGCYKPLTHLKIVNVIVCRKYNFVMPCESYYKHKKIFVTHTLLIEGW